MKRIFGCLIIALLISPSILLSTDYYVDGTNGNNNNNGRSISAAWKTITKANSTLQAGDTVYIMAGMYTTTDGNAIINPDNNGTSGNPITYTNYATDTVIIRPAEASCAFGAYISKNYIVIDGLEISEASYPGSYMSKGVLIGLGTDHVTVQNCTIKNTMPGGGGHEAIGVYNNCDYISILRNVCDNVGYDGIKFYDQNQACGSKYALIEGNTLEGSFGHACLNVSGEYFVIKDNTFSNDKDKGVDILRWTSSTDAPSYYVIEGNTFFDCTSGDGREPGMQNMSRYQIIRKNRFYGNTQWGLNFWGNANGDTNNNKVYHNVFYGNGTCGVNTVREAIKFDDNDNTGSCNDNILKNNIFYNNYEHESGPTDLQYNNCTAAEQTFANNWWHDYGNPQYVNASNNNFNLQSSSPCIDAGAFPTQTRSSGSGTQIPVQDAGYFCDGFNITQGDTIQLEGQLETARITNVNYDNNTITVNNSLNWYSGQGVSLAYAGYAPDIGAYEYTGTTPPTPLIASVNGSPGTGYIPLTVNFTGSATGGTPPYSYSWTFGDGGTSTSQNPSHTYTTVGDFTATLTVTDNASNKDTDSIIIHASSLSENFTLSMSLSTGAPAPGAGGTVNPPPGDHGYSSGTNVQIQATPNSNYRFSRWTGDIDDALIGNSQFTLTMDADKSISAKFCTRCGDVNGDVTITPIDAQLIFDMFLGILSNPTLCQRENADVNCDGTRDDPNVTPLDAQAIFDFYLGKSGLPGDCSCNSRSSTSGLLMTMTSRKDNFDFNILVQDPLTLPGGDEILVPVMIDSSIRLESFGFDLEFDSEQFEFVGVTRAELTEDFIQIGANVVGDGILRVGGYRDQTYEDCSPGELVILIFRVKREIEESTIFQIFKTYDDLKNAAVDAGRETLIR